MSDGPQQPSKTPQRGTHVFQAPKGTRDFYPEDFARRKFVFDAWRDAAIRHGFDEIDGPTFEHLDLYTVKSGEGIVSELFSFKRFGGETDFALRPEFTPTLARMVAARANALPKPTKWFSIANYFRAERPQRGRLREFAQWNCDTLGDPSPEADAEVIACCVEVLRELKLLDDVRIHINDRFAFGSLLTAHGIEDSQHGAVFSLLDQANKLAEGEFHQRADVLGIPTSIRILFLRRGVVVTGGADNTLKELLGDTKAALAWLAALEPLRQQLLGLGVPDDVIVRDSTIVRGLAYYTGTVFEVHEAGGKERAIAGGGRYDNLVELFGGPPTPAVGFAMGDVVLSLVLEDKGLMPKDAELMRRVGAAPDVFVISNGKEESEAALRPTVAMLRRAGLHARRSYKTTRNVGKLLKEAADTGARFAAIIENATVATLKNLGTGEQRTDAPVEGLAALVGPASRGPEKTA